MGLIETGARWLTGQRHEHLSVPVTYVRAGTVDEISIQATPIVQDRESDRAIAVGQDVELREWIVREEDLIDSGGLPFRPSEGDMIREDAGGETRSYRASALGEDTTVWRWSDSAFSSLRITTRLYEVTP